MSSPLRQRVRLLLSVVSVLVALALLVAGWFYWSLRRSLPLLEGNAQLAGLSAKVTIARDHLGVPTLAGATRNDVIRALGFLHAQDRFFQMDLLRRRGAGELAALFGEVALPIDKSTRVHGFRTLAAKVFTQLVPAQREVLESYTAGVNAGLSALKQKPFEYLVLRTDPIAWKPEDSILVIYAMTFDLQDSTGSYEIMLATLRDQLGLAGLAFFAPLSVPNDAALDGTTEEIAPIPSAEILNLRTVKQAATVPAVRTFDVMSPARDPEALVGSNSFALSGAHTASGSAMVANDPHLDLGVPTTWYRASLSWNSPAEVRVTGVTLPGLPAIIIGSNGHIAWTLTDAYADTGDIVSMEMNSIDRRLYQIPGNDSLIAIEQRSETIEVKGEPAVTIEVPWTHWGPIVGKGSDGRPQVYHWLAHDMAATDLSYLNLMEAQNVADALVIAHHAGMPAHNFIVADTAGQIAWTIVGRLPKRVGFDGRLPTSWSYGDRRWEGLLPPDETPTVVAPAEGRLWSANNRLVGGAALKAIGDGGYAAPMRARQIRDALMALEKAAPRDLQAIQLDDRALLLAPWQKRLLAVLTPEAVAGKKARAEFRRAVENWEGRASVDSVSYRLVRAFRSRTADLALTPIFAGCVEADPRFDWRKFHYEEPLQTLLREQPLHLLDAKYSTWDELQLAAVDAVIADYDRQNLRLDRATWGQRNTAKIYHPFGRMLPGWLAGWLNLPADPLPGDTDMPRIQTPSMGASMRLVVSPGRESEGLLHMAGGQSGHPLSPYYRAGHEAWVKGEPTPFLPGAVVHTLILAP